MVEQCGGYFEMSSEPGRGTSARISLPLADATQAATPAPQATPPAATPDSAPRPLRILAVDDDALILMNTTMMLADMGHEPIEAMSAADALQVLAEQDVDLLLTDFAMPGMTGNDLIKEARKLRPGLRAIMASGYADLPPGADLDVPRLAKPFSEAALADIVKKVTSG
ncbi:MAG: response regulator [Proteobacteria bacterium]|nr:MAG: response regulator [Pseudomonadota bacterium]